MRGGVGEELPFYTLYFGTHLVERWYSGGDSGYVREVDPKGERINVCVDNYNDETHYVLCDCNNTGKERIELRDYDLTKWAENNDKEKES